MDAVGRKRKDIVCLLMNNLGLIEPSVRHG